MRTIDAYMSSSCRSATLKDWWPDLSTGVCSIPNVVSKTLLSDAKNISYPSDQVCSSSAKRLTPGKAPQNAYLQIRLQ